MRLPAEFIPVVTCGSPRYTIHEMTGHWINLPVPEAGAGATPENR